LRRSIPKGEGKDKKLPAVFRPAGAAAREESNGDRAPLSGAPLNLVASLLCCLFPVAIVYSSLASFYSMPSAICQARFILFSVFLFA
jgi:hypothetical protein